MKIHYAITDYTRCGLYTTDESLVTCNNCLRRSGGFVRAEQLQYILKTMIDIFRNLMHDEDREAFKKEHPGLNWKLGFEEAIYDFADRRSSRELMIAALIKDIKSIETRGE